MPKNRKPCTKDLPAIPAWFEAMRSMPGDPEDSVPYGYVSEGTKSFLLVAPVSDRAVMPFHDPGSVIDEIHQTLREDQGLIEVDSGITRSQRRFIYSIVKTVRRMRGVLYTLTLQLEQDGPEDSARQIRGFFEEAGATGARDAMVYALLSRQGLVRVTEDDIAGWVKDPYQETYTFGIPMNLSEEARFDALFPNHPLSETRRFVKTVIYNN